jgi:hypothetical protein
MAMGLFPSEKGPQLPGKEEMVPQIAHDHFLPNPFQLIFIPLNSLQPDDI